jgi:hypothetical protein
MDEWWVALQGDDRREERSVSREPIRGDVRPDTASEQGLEAS